ncbi:MAG: ferrous iron transport protein A [Flavobacteriaceae bacterium]|nr:ferrous iron transport protein A [Flavobacteriaceae bacterium]
MLTISDLKKGERGIIVKFLIDIPLPLIEMGCFPGREVLMIQEAPLKDPLCLEINGTRMAIRREMAKNIQIEKI